MVLPLDPKLAAFYGTFVEAAYAMYKNDTNNKTPPAQGIPAGYKLVAWIQMSDFIIDKTPPGFYGFIAQSTSNTSHFVLAVRGTSNATEWWDNFHALMKPFSKVSGAGSVSSGFLDIYNTLIVVDVDTPATAPVATGNASAAQQKGMFASQVAQIVRSRIPTAVDVAHDGPESALPPGSSLVVTGHSLGAALATMYVLDSSKNHGLQNPVLCTFASPRVGNASFAKAWNDLKVTSWRIANAPDIVPNLPPDFFGYVHLDALTLLNSTGKVKSTLSCAHAMSTYLSMLDQTIQPGADCTVASGDEALFMHAADAMAQAPQTSKSPTPVLAGTISGGLPPPTDRASAESLPIGGINMTINIWPST